MKKTAKAHSNIALVKYWGKKGDENLRLPVNSSMSVALDSAYTLTTVEWDAQLEQDEVGMIDDTFSEKEKVKVSKHLDRVREMAGITTRARVVSKNNFPKAAGMASSASGFAALSMAAASAAGLELSSKELSILARKGSGSASRSIPGGIARWNAGESSETSYAERVEFPEDWKIKILLVMAEDTSAKKVGSTEGMAIAPTSPYFDLAVSEGKKDIERIKQAMDENNWSGFGRVIENECYRLHMMCMTSQPNILYWKGMTVEVFQALYTLRDEGIEAFFTVDAGPHVHVICKEDEAEQVKEKLSEIDGIKTVVECGVGPEARTVEEDLF
jgi:diphosphomevalonate decarboxylase